MSEKGKLTKKGIREEMVKRTELLLNMIAKLTGKVFDIETRLDDIENVEKVIDDIET